jgi:thioredoxin-like negative regulator of GroEL
MGLSRPFGKVRRFILLGLLALLLGHPARAESLRWYDNLEEASSAARESNRPIMIDFWATWCSACKVMENDVYKNDEFMNAAPQFLAVRIDFDKKQAIARKYGVAELPTLIFTDSNGTELFRYSGFIGAKALAELLRSLPADVSELNRLDRILERDKRNLEALESMGKDLRTAGLFVASNDYFRKALQTNEAKADPSTRESIMTQMGANFLEVRDGRQAAETFERCLKNFPNSRSQPDWELNLARSYAMSNKRDAARKLLRAFIGQHPTAAESENARTLLDSL